ncbi:MAG TPA: haloacid dehalogenase type II, partial [Spirochaetes bacterium]|nr:haloacid dehalogenase type II [Spirochaetota bacterium]
TAGVITLLEQYVGSEASAFACLWRDKQLEYSFRRGLMKAYQPFHICTRDALDYTATFFHKNLKPSEKDKLMGEYQILPPFPDVEEGLSPLKSSGFSLFAFSNGLGEDVRSLLQNAKIAHYFKDIISVDEVKTFKPAPEVYRHLLDRTGTVAHDTWLISSNSFDIIGALSTGLSAAWVKRSADATFDPWDVKASITVSSIKELQERIIIK